MPCFESVEVIHIENGIFCSPDISESSLRDSSVKRHLSAFESRSYSAAASGLLSVHTSSGSLTLSAWLYRDLFS